MVECVFMCNVLYYYPADLVRIVRNTNVHKLRYCVSGKTMLWGTQTRPTHGLLLLNSYEYFCCGFSDLACIIINVCELLSLDRKSVS